MRQPDMAIMLAVIGWINHAAADPGLTLTVFNNSALAPPHALNKTVPGMSFSLSTAPDVPVSAELTGTLIATRGDTFAFSCVFTGAAVAFLHIDDHLVCQHGANSGHCDSEGSTWCNGTDSPLPVRSRTSLPVRLSIVAAPGSVDVTATVTLSVVNGSGPPLFDTALPALEVLRRDMQAALLQGWGAFYAMSYLDHVLLPEAARVKLALCPLGNNSGIQPTSCLVETRIDWPDSTGPQADVRPGPHAYDRSYSRIYVEVDGCNVSVSAGGGQQLLVLVEVVPGSGGDKACDNVAIVPMGLSTWFRANNVTASATALTFASAGLGSTTVFSTLSSDATLNISPEVAAQPHLAFRLSSGFRLGLNSGDTPLPLATIAAMIDAAAATEMSRYTKYGALAETKEAVQAAVMWQAIYNPIEQGPFAPVIRGNPWGLDKGTTNSDWAYVMFDWDNHFGALMLSFDAKELGYSALIQVIKGKTNQGFVANVAASVNKQRHSQPPVGGKILLEMFKKYNETWIVELLFDDLLDWNTWFDQNRRLAPLGIGCLGSEEGDMQDARFESGLDNSPMYDSGECVNGHCGGWNCSSTSGGKETCQCFIDEKMQLYDVGMASMHAMDCDALAYLGMAIGRTDDVTLLRKRAVDMRDLIELHLWDVNSSAYVNLMPDNRFYRRVSPTSFYALQTGGPSDDRAAAMVSQWLLNPDRFCITPNGDFRGNSDACYWGLPSIEASDPAFKSLGYWRGYVWGPMSLLTYWGLQNYDHVPVVRTARKALCTQMTEMMMDKWREHRLICENYYPAKVHEGCSPGAMHFYHWGALNGFISLVESGMYY